MNTHADKTQENKNQSLSNGASQMQSGGESTFQFIDKRPEAIAQRKLQEMANNSPKTKQAAQLQAITENSSSQQKQSIQKKENNTGLPDNLKLGIENLSGYSMNDVKVHYNSAKPAQLNAHAHAQGTDIHLASGQEKHHPHEAWHVVQQKHGRVKPIMQMKGKVNINDDASLEEEADVMGAVALLSQNRSKADVQLDQFIPTSHSVQRILRQDFAQELGVELEELIGSNYNISEEDEFVIRKIWEDSPNLRGSLLSGFKLSTARDFNKFVGSLKLNYENILRGLGQSESPPLSRDLSKANFPNTIEEVLRVIPGHSNVRVLVPLEGRAQVGVEYSWATTDGTPVTIRMHSYELDRGITVDDLNQKEIPIHQIIENKRKINAGKGWIYRAIVGGEAMDIHGNWHVIENLTPPIEVPDPGNYSKTQIPAEAAGLSAVINGLTTNLSNDQHFQNLTKKNKEKDLKTLLDSTQGMDAVPKERMRFVRSYIIEKSQHLIAVRTHQQFLIDAARYEQIMNDIHIPLV